MTNNKLPVKQRTKDLDALFQEAYNVGHILEKFAQKMHRKLGAGYDTKSLYKSVESAKRKLVDRGFGDDASEILDFTRIALIGKDMQEIQKIRKAVEKEFPGANVKDRFKKPSETGYQDLKFNVKLPLWEVNGEMRYHIAEIQIHLEELYEKKPRLDYMYHIFRSKDCNTSKAERIYYLNTHRKIAKEAGEKAGARKELTLDEAQKILKKRKKSAKQKTLQP